MKKTEKILLAISLIALGVLAILLRDTFIGLLMTLIGGALAVWGVVDIFRKNLPIGIVKIVTGLLLILCGWAITEAVVYILAGLVLTFGILYLCDTFKRGARCPSFWAAVWEYSLPVLSILVGGLLLFHRGSMVNFVFISCGVLTIAIGGILLAEALSKD